MFRIVVDAMGGDNAPAAIVQGAAEASLALQAAEIILVGDAAAISLQLARTRHDGARVRVHHAASDATTEPSATRADTSIEVAAELVARGDGDALVSAGSSSASMRACTRHWKRIDGIHRPALAAVFPTELRRGDSDDPFSLVLDVGATPEASAADLVQFAAMGSAYAALISRHRRPRVALLSNGSESGTGTREVIAAHAVLRTANELNFIGNIEGIDIPRGVADVVVTAGFVGGVVLHMLEGVSETVVRLARYAHKERLAWRLGLVAISSAIDQLKTVTDWRQYGGAPLLGFAQPFVQVHSRAGARTITNATKIAHQALVGDLCGTIARAVAKPGSGTPTAV